MLLRHVADVFAAADALRYSFDVFAITRWPRHAERCFLRLLDTPC